MFQAEAVLLAKGFCVGQESLLKWVRHAEITAPDYWEGLDDGFIELGHRVSAKDQFKG